MNWLIYVGGGWCFFLIVFGTLNTLVTVDKKSMGYVSRVITLLSTILVWIWICWRFIR